MHDFKGTCDNCGGKIIEDWKESAIKDFWVNGAEYLCEDCEQELGEQDVYSEPR